MLPCSHSLPHSLRRTNMPFVLSILYQILQVRQTPIETFVIDAPNSGQFQRIKTINNNVISCTAPPMLQTVDVCKHLGDRLIEFLRHGVPHLNGGIERTRERLVLNDRHVCRSLRTSRLHGRCMPLLRSAAACRRNSIRRSPRCSPMSIA